MMRRFFARVFGLEQPAPTHADPLQQVYADALLLIAAAYRGDPWSRRAFVKRLSQPRWTAAFRLLQTTGVLDRRGRLDWHVAPDAETAEVLAREAVNEWRRRRRESKNFVAPLP